MNNRLVIKEIIFQQFLGPIATVLFDFVDHCPNCENKYQLGVNCAHCKKQLCNECELEYKQFYIKGCNDCVMKYIAWNYPEYMYL